MPSHAADFARLSLLVERLLDAELLLAEEGATLLAETDTARRSLDAGDAETAREHLERLMRYLEALVRSEALDLANGRAVVETARQIVAGDAD